jgi:hypothetical protein
MSDKVIIALCRQIKTNGHRCQSPAIKGTKLCFHHRNIHRTHRKPQTAESLMSTWKEDTLKGYRTAEIDPLAVARAYPKQNEFHFPALEDAESVQLATSMLFQAIATGQIHFLRAKMLLNTLKVATLNMRAVTTAARFMPDPGPIPTQVVRTTSGHILAAPSEDAPGEDKDTCAFTEVEAEPIVAAHSPDITESIAAEQPSSVLSSTPPDAADPVAIHATQVGAAKASSSNQPPAARYRIPARRNRRR